MNSLALPSPDQLHRFCEIGQGGGVLHVDHSGGVPSVDACLSLVKTCSNKSRAKWVHAYLALHGLDQIDALSQPLLIAFSKLSGFEDSLCLFHRLPSHSVVSWTSVISSCVDSRNYEEALHLYHHMQEEGVDPNSYTFVALLKACGGLHNVDILRELHADIKKQGLGFDLFIGSTLVSVYGKCGRTTEAENVFAGLVELDLVSWNAMLLAYVEQGEGEKALQLFRQLHEERVRASERTFVLVLQACCILVESEDSPMQTRVMCLEVGQSLHADALKSGYSLNVFVASTLINLYSKLGSLEEAENVFTSLIQPDTVLWNAMLLAYVEWGQMDKSLRLYSEMLKGGFYPSEQTFTILFQACCMLAREEETIFMEENWIKTTSLEICRALHEDACKNFLDGNLFVRRILVEMYGSNESIVEAEAVFLKYPECDSVLLNAMLAEYVKCGRPKDAVGLYEDMLNRFILIDEQTIIVALQAVFTLAEEEEPAVGSLGSKMRSLNSGQRLHIDAQIRGYDLDPFVGCTLLTMYGKCGSISEAEKVFTGFSEYDPVLWTCMLSTYVDHGKEQESLYLYRQMKEEGMDPDEPAFEVLLEACSHLGGKIDMTSAEAPLLSESLLEICQGLHADFRKAGLKMNAFVGNGFLKLYGKYGNIQEVNNLFTGFDHHDTVTWNALLLAYAEQGLPVQMLQLFVQMQQDGVNANGLTFRYLLKACCMLSEQEADDVGNATDCGSYESVVLNIGRALHTDAWRRGFVLDVVIASTLLHLYGKCGSINEAEVVFSGLKHMDVVSWTGMLSAYVHHGQGEKALWLYRQMQEEGIGLDDQAFVAAFQACCALAKERRSEFIGVQIQDLVPLRIGQAVHVDALRKGTISNVYVRSSLLCMYCKCSNIMEVEGLCSSFLCGSPVSWNAMILAYIEQSYAKKALLLYLLMQEEDICPDEQTYLLTLQACSILAENGEFILSAQENKMMCLEIGQALYLDASQKGLNSGEFVVSALLIMYGKCGSVLEAEALFSGFSECSTAVWNSLASVYVEHDQCLKVLELYDKMQLEGLSPDGRTFVISLHACGNLEGTPFLDGQPIVSKSSESIWKLHADACKCGFDQDPFVRNALLSVYGKSGSIIEAESVFNKLSQLDIVSWNGMLSAYVKHAQEEKALELYRQMQEEGISLNDITFICILDVCKGSGRAEICKQIHFEIVASMEQLSLPLATSLTSAYGSCGCMVEAREVFDSTPHCGVVLWSALLAGYAQEGNSSASLHTYMEMQLRGIEPDDITLLSLLSVYNHTGLVQEGIECYKSLCNTYSIMPDTKHFVSFLDLLGRAGDLAELRNLVSSTAVDSNLVMWLCVLRACGKHGNVELGKVAFNQAIHIQPEQAVVYVLMSNFYADTELWEHGQKTPEN